MADTATEEKTRETEAAAEQTPPPAAEESAAETPREPVADREPEDAPVEADAPAGERTGSADAARSMGFLGSLELEAAAELGRAKLSVSEVLELQPGSVVQLEKMLGDPAELMIDDQLIARGEVVVVDDRFGLRITEVASRESE